MESFLSLVEKETRRKLFPSHIHIILPEKKLGRLKQKRNRRKLQTCP